MAKTVTDETDEGLFGLRMPFGGFKEAAEAFQVRYIVAYLQGYDHPVQTDCVDAVCLIFELA